MKSFKKRHIWLLSQHYATLPTIPGREEEKDKFVGILAANRAEIESLTGANPGLGPESIAAWDNHSENLELALSYVETFGSDDEPAEPAVPQYVYVATLFENPAWGLRDPNNRDHYRGVRAASTHEMAELKAKVGIKNYRNGSYQIVQVEV